jgi:hypothetical protein
MKLKIYTWIALLFFAGIAAQAQPVITARFANPELNCDAETYCVDVEFQSSLPNQMLFGMNVRFFYPEDQLSFISFGEFVAGYAASFPNPPDIWSISPGSGDSLFSYPGAAVFVNGSVQKVTSSTAVLSTTGWTKIFNICFHVEDPEAFNDPAFCPSLIWDLMENPSQGGMLMGIVMTVVSGSGSGPAIENAAQFNWQYDGIPGLPHGFPVQTSCLETHCSLAPNTILPVKQALVPGVIQIPVTVTNFEEIGHFCLNYEYDPLVMTFLGYTPNPLLTQNNNVFTFDDLTSSNGKRRISMSLNSPGLTLDNGDTLVLVTYNLISGSTSLNWITDGQSCHYTDITNFPLYDLPYNLFYVNGSAQLLSAPVTKVDSIVSGPGTYATFPLKVWGYNNISSGTLTLDYDPSVITFYQNVPNSSISTSFTTNSTQSGRLIMSWSGANLSLPDASVLVYMTFIYTGGTAPLAWFDDGLSCQYIHGILGQPLYDNPTNYYYITGNVAPAEFIWTGDLSSDWYTSGNWLDGIVPDPYTNVVIDPAVTRSGFPVFNGNFTIGLNCKNLTITGNAQFTITGNLTIDPGRVLEFDGDGVVQVGGSWTNSGIFIPGNGTVEFIGSQNAAITDGVNPVNYVSAYQRSTFPVGMTVLSGATPGPTADNGNLDVSIGFPFNYLGVNYNQIRINANGWASLNLSGSVSVSTDNLRLFTNGNPNTTLAPWWDDLKPDANGIVSYKLSGTTPNRVFTVEWKNILAYSTGASARLNFQLKLYETTNVIEFCYGTATSGTHHANESASIGIDDATGGTGHFIEATQNSINLVLSVLKSQNDWPAVNYRFTPPVASDTEVFHKVTLNKDSGSQLSILKDSHVTGIE